MVLDWINSNGCCFKSEFPCVPLSIYYILAFGLFYCLSNSQSRGWWKRCAQREIEAAQLPLNVKRIVYIFMWQHKSMLMLIEIKRCRNPDAKTAESRCVVDEVSAGLVQLVKLMELAQIALLPRLRPRHL